MPQYNLNIHRDLLQTLLLPPTKSSPIKTHSPSLAAPPASTQAGALWNQTQQQVEQDLFFAPQQIHCTNLPGEKSRD